MTKEERKLVFKTLADVKTDPRYEELSYRRGVSQALSRATEIVASGGTADDLGLLTDLSMEMRYDRKPHLAYLDTLWGKYREAKDAARKVQTEGVT